MSIIKINSLTLTGTIKTVPKIEEVELNLNQSEPKNSKAKKASFVMQFASQGAVPESEINVVAWGKNADVIENLGVNEQIGIMGILRAFYTNEEKKVVEILVKQVFLSEKGN